MSRKMGLRLFRCENSGHEETDKGASVVCVISSYVFLCQV